MQRLLLISLVFISFFASSQNYLIDDFSGESLKENWQSQGTTFSISLEEESMRIDYVRDANSWEWDQFHYIMNETIELTSYEIHLKIKSSIQTQLTLKPVYTDGSDDWIQLNINATDEWLEIAFPSVSGTTRTLETIYFYFDAGSTNDIEGLIYMDDIILESRSTSLLASVIDNAVLYQSHAVEGGTEGEFENGSKAVYQQAIDQAILVLNNPDATQEQINEEVESLFDANRIMELSCNRHQLVSSENLILVNEYTTRETRNLYHNLSELDEHHLLFGHHDVTAYGIGWYGDKDRSDVKDVCGSYPAIASWDFAGIAQGTATTDDYYRVEYYHNNGGINTFCWHYNNPYGGDFYWNNNPYPDSNVVASLLPGGYNHEHHRASLDNIASFCKTVKGSRGESIPIVFRPWHEHNGSWFWWGENHCSIEEFKELWQFTVDYLIIEKQVNNLLFAYSPDVFINKAKYLQRYPGDDYVDILGFDDYEDLKRESGLDRFRQQLIYLVEMAEERNKIAALTETGLERITEDNWFTHFLNEPVESHESSKKIAWAVVWRNASESHFYAPYPGHSSVPDFLDFYENDFSMFMNQLPELFDQVIIDYEPNSISESIIEEFNLSYPNPFADEIRISEEYRGEYKIYNTNGQLIQSGSKRKGEVIRIDTGNWPKGIFVLIFDDLNRGRLSRKLVKY